MSQKKCEAYEVELILKSAKHYHVRNAYLQCTLYLHS